MKSKEEIALKMLEQLIISGFGGQGVLLIGKLLGYSAALEGKKATYLPSYGPEMRGGTANCQVVISDHKIYSPVFGQPTSVIALNLPSLDKFEPTIKPGGLLVINSNMVNRKSLREDIRSCEVPANRIAEEMGNSRMANLVALGGYIAASCVVSPESIIDCLSKPFSGEKSRLIPANAEAFKAGLTRSEIERKP